MLLALSDCSSSLTLGQLAYHTGMSRIDIRGILGRLKEMGFVVSVNTIVESYMCRDAAMVESALPGKSHEPTAHFAGGPEDRRAA